MDRLPTLIQGYSPKNIWNEDETACFYRALPDKTLAEAKNQCTGGKKAKIRVTLAFIVNAEGEKELPIVIGKAASPRCFKGLKDKKNPLGIPYYNNAKAWMDSVIMDDILTKCNKRLVQQDRKVILFLDNVSSHNPDLCDKFSNIKVVFLPKNTTSRLQPLDAGIIKNFKVHYKKKLVRYAFAQINGTSATATDIMKKIDVLTAIRWVKQAWEEVGGCTIQNCFKHCGFHPVPEPTVDPFADLDVTQEMEEMVQQLDPSISASEYITADEDVQTSANFEDQGNWREELRDTVITSSISPKKKPSSRRK